MVEQLPSSYQVINKLLSDIILLKITLDVTLSNVTPLGISLLNVNFNKSIVGLDSLLILYMLAKFQYKINNYVINHIFKSYAFLSKTVHKRGGF